MELNELTLQDLEALEVKKEEESQTISKANSFIDDEYMDIKKQIAELELKLIPLQKARKQGSHNQRRIESELRNIRHYKFKRLRGE